MYGRVYVANCLANGKLYVGQTINSIAYRWKSHCKPSRVRGHGIFSKAIQKHGSQNFEVFEVAEAESREQLDNLEKLWILLLSSHDRNRGYNRTLGGDGSLTEDARQLMRVPRPSTAAKLRGRKRSPETIALMRAANIGRPHTKQWSENHARMMTGRKHSPETKAKMSAWRTQYWKTKLNHSTAQ